MRPHSSSSGGTCPSPSRMYTSCLTPTSAARLASARASATGTRRSFAPCTMMSGGPPRSITFSSPSNPPAHDSTAAMCGVFRR